MDLQQAANEKFREDFDVFAKDYCGGSYNSYTLDLKKRERVLQCLRNAKNESSARFRFWVRSKNFRIFQSADGEEILALPPKPGDPDGDTLYRRVAVIDEFFDIIFAAHSENGHVGQAQTFRAIKAMYALVPRTVIIKFIEMCPVCYKSQMMNAAKKKMNQERNNTLLSCNQLAGDHAAFSVQKRVEDADDLEPAVFETQLTVTAHNPLAEAGPSSVHDVTTTLNEILAGKLEGSDLDPATVAAMDDTPTSTHVLQSSYPTATSLTSAITATTTASTTVPLFSCHLCKDVFSKKKTLQQHIQNHQDYRPAVPLQQKLSPSSKRRKLNIGFSSPFAGKLRKGGVARKKLIIDVDSGPMAAQAIMLAASRPDIDLMAINCVVGSVSVLNACENALRVLKACGREDVAVCRGAEKSLLGLSGRESNLPGTVWSQKVEGHVQAEHSVSSLIRHVNEYPGEITLICMGPLTNLALALRLDPFAATHLKDIYIVGGNIEGQGDMLSACAEHNFLFDPEAAHIVFQEAHNAYVLPYEVSQRNSIPFEHLVTCLNVGSDKSNFLIESMTQEELQLQTGGMVAPEVFAVAMVIDATILLERERVYATVELKGDYSRGMMVVDKRGVLSKEPNVSLVKNLDLGKTQGLFAAIFTSPDDDEVEEPHSNSSSASQSLHRQLKLTNV